MGQQNASHAPQLRSCNYNICLQGEYGLYEAVQEIKMKKDELAVRDKWICSFSSNLYGVSPVLYD